LQQPHEIPKYGTYPPSRPVPREGLLPP